LTLLGTLYDPPDEFLDCLINYIPPENLSNPDTSLISARLRILSKWEEEDRISTMSPTLAPTQNPVSAIPTPSGSSPNNRSSSAGAFRSTSSSAMVSSKDQKKLNRMR